jgi:hypothetical protein
LSCPQEEDLWYTYCQEVLLQVENKQEGSSDGGGWGGGQHGPHRYDATLPFPWYYGVKLSGRHLLRKRSVFWCFDIPVLLMKPSIPVCFLWSFVSQY